MSNDFVYTLTCKSVNATTGAESGECDGQSFETSFPMNGGVVVGNNIAENIRHEYELKIKYLETNEDQTDDMNKTLEAQVNIADIKALNPYKDNTDSLAYNIINNAVALTNQEKELGYAELVGTPYTKVASDISEIKNQQIGYEVPEEISISFTPANQKKYITYATEYNINTETGKFNLINPKACLYSDNNCIRDLINDNKTVYIPRNTAKALTSSDGTLKSTTELDYVYKLIKTPEVSETENINLIVKRISNNVESVISIIQDKYGTSYYYRGAVKNNYVNFNKMCWRIVRIEGDGSIRMILADKEAECSLETLSKKDSSIIGLGYLTYPYDINYLDQHLYDYIGQPYVEEEGVYDPYDVEAFEENMNHVKRTYDVFLNGGTIEYLEKDNYQGDIKDVIIKKEYEGFDKQNLDLLKTEIICIGDRSKTYTKESEMVLYPYLTLNRLYNDKYATLLCSGNNYTEPSKVFPLTIDEVVLAGGIYSISDTYNNYSYYLRENAITNWWLLSNAGNLYENNTGLIFTYYFVFDDYKISLSQDNIIHGIRPVISLIPNVELTKGDGTIANPYVIG